MLDLNLNVEKDNMPTITVPIINEEAPKNISIGHINIAI
jgi:hypothetical protein